MGDDMGENEQYVTCEKCESHRNDFAEREGQQDILISALQADNAYNKNLLMCIFGTLVIGFAGTIFAVLSAGA